MENVFWGCSSPTLCCTEPSAGDHGEQVLTASAWQKQQRAGEDGEWHRRRAEPDWAAPIKPGEHHG